MQGAEWLSRTASLIGGEAVEKLEKAKIIIFGVGGVGGYAFEALVRSGVGSIAIVDSDTVSESNLNRQIIATRSSLGRLKVEAARQRALDINPDVKITVFPIFYSDKTEEEIDLGEYDYVIDAIDSVSSKVRLIENAKKKGVRIISSMGAGNKLNPMGFKTSDIYKTSVCPLARAVRTELKKRGISSLKCVYSEEAPVVGRPGERIPASVATVPSAAGLLIASEVIHDIISQ